jgi:hypothetical protein
MKGVESSFLGGREREYAVVRVQYSEKRRGDRGEDLQEGREVAVRERSGGETDY